MREERDLVPFEPAALPDGPWLVFAPHPDDEVLGMGGTLALAAARGVRVEVVVVTGGDHAGDPAVRRGEALAAGAVLGVARHHFWDLPDRGVASAPLPAAALRALLGELRPRTVFLPGLQEFHPDHRAVARRIFAALPPGPTVWLYEITRQGEANRLVNISAVNGTKQAAIACFASQLALADYGGLIDGLNRARALTLGPGAGRVEAFWQTEDLDDQLAAVGRYAADPPVPAPPAPLLEEPWVSVIVRTKDRPALLAEALASIAAQTYPRIETLVVNDGGAPVTVGPGVRLIELARNEGRAAAANRGLAAAGSPLIAFLDDDDVYVPGAIQFLVESLGHSHVVYGRVVQRTPDGDRDFATPFDRQLLLVENFIPLNALLFRREVLDEAGPLREDLPFLEDWELLLRVCDRHAPVFHDRLVAFYRSFGVSTAQGTRFSADDFRRGVHAIMRRRWSQVTPEGVKGYGEKLAGAFEWHRRDLAAQVNRLRADNGRLERLLDAGPVPSVPLPERRDDGRDHVLLLCPEPIRAAQQGIGIRFREMAAELAAEHQVVLFAPNRDLPPLPFVRPFDEAVLVRLLPRTRAVVVQGAMSETYLGALDRHAVTDAPPLVCDLYDPFLVENLTYTRTLGPEVYLRDRAILLRQLARGDRFLVSSRAQIAFHAGLMMGQGLFSPTETAIEELFAVAPFGVRPPPPATAPAARDEKVLFFGGIYDWYDPHLLLDALPDGPIRVLFSANPSPRTTPQGVYASVVERVARDPALGARVSFIPWFPYEERHARLAGVDVAVCLHRPSLETDLSLRTRVLDALACGVPVVATDGGETAGLLRASGGAALVPAGDRDALRRALAELLGDGELRRRMGERAAAWVQARMSWSQTLAPLRAFCRDPRHRRVGAGAIRPSAPAPAAAPRIEAGAAALSSVIIPSFNGRRFLGDCLASLAAQRLPRERYEVIVVDNGSNDDSRAFLAARHPDVRLVALDRNTGFTGGIAAGVAAARGDRLVFLNNDMRVDPGWLAAYEDAGAPCATGMVLDWTGEKVNFVGGILTFDGHALQPCQGSPAAAYRGLRPGPTFIATGGNMAVRRDLFARLGGFDGDYFAYSEDVNFSWRLHAAGQGVTFVPGALAYHHGQGTSTTALGVYRRGLLYETNAFATLFKNADAACFDALLHAAWLVLVNRTMRILHTYAPRATFLRPGATYAAPDLRTRLRELRRLGPQAAVGETLRLLAERIEQNGPSADLRHPHAVMQLEAVGRVLAGVNQLNAKRARVQALRARPDAEIFRRFPLWVVDTYPGDRELFASPAFRALLPRDLPFRHATVGEIHAGTAPVGDHPDL